MTIANPRQTLSRLLLGSLLLGASPKTASSQQNDDTDNPIKQVAQACLTAPAQQALPACQQLTTVLSLVPDIPVQTRGGINSRLRDVLVELGRFAEAEAPARSAVAAALESKKRPAIVAQQNGLATVLRYLGRYSEAEELFRSATELAKKEYGAEHLQVAAKMGNLAVVLKDQGKLTEAESLFRKSLAIKEKKLEPDHPDLATTLGNLAGVLQDQGKLTEAESLYRKSLAIQEKKLEPDHPDLAKSHSNLALLRLERGEIKGAVAEEQKSIQGFDQQLRTSLTEDQAEALLTANSGGEDLVYGLPLLSGAPPEAGRLAMSTALLFKGRTLEAGRMVRRKLQQGLKTEAQKQKYQTMVELLGRRDQELSRLAQGSGERDKAQQLLWQAQKLERELSKEVGVMSSADVPTLENVSQKVAQALRTDSDAVLVEVGLAMTADYSRGSEMEIAKTGAFHYVAMMLFPSGEVRVVRLGGKYEVESVAATFLAALNSGSKDMKAVAQAAYSALFAPLEKELGGATRIILSPDGALSAIPFAALHDNKGYLVERLSFRYVSSGRDLLNVPSALPTGQPAVMMATRVPGQNPLPDAEQTGRELAQMQRAKLTAGATDGQVLAQQSPSVLTLISHGYFRAETKTYGMSARLPTAPKQRVRPKYMNQMAFERDRPAQAPVVMAEKENTEELMNSSGLMMMPGPTASTDSKQDGRLTGVEVREMNLQGTKLVMLLACNGAAGGVSFGQGVYGLRRAVLQAGAETVVGTLWSVEEKSASELAKNYMTKLWTDKKATRVGAMEAAMKEMRSNPRYSHPHYWAPFVVMGMDGPLGN